MADNEIKEIKASIVKELEVRSKDVHKELELYKKAIEDIEVICVEQNLKFDTTACEVLDVIEKLFETLNNQ